MPDEYNFIFGGKNWKLLSFVHRNFNAAYMRHLQWKPFWLDLFISWCIFYTLMKSISYHLKTLRKYSRLFCEYALKCLNYYTVGSTNYHRGLSVLSCPFSKYSLGQIISEWQYIVQITTIYCIIVSETSSKYRCKYAIIYRYIRCQLFFLWMFRKGCQWHIISCKNQNLLWFITSSLLL